MNIYLIGMPGSGKTTIAKALSKTLMLPMIDLDAKIEEDALMFIDEIFEIYDEKTFRELETEALKALKDDDVIVSCGGGIVTRAINRSHMHGTIIYLKCRIDTLERRLAIGFGRPLLKDKPLSLLEKERSKHYEAFADHIVSNDDTVDLTVETIIDLIEERMKS